MQQKTVILLILPHLPGRKPSPENEPEYFWLREGGHHASKISNREISRFGIVVLRKIGKPLWSAFTLFCSKFKKKLKSFETESTVLVSTSVEKAGVLTKQKFKIEINMTVICQNNCHNFNVVFKEIEGFVN